MDAPKDKALQELIERSQSLIQQSRELKADQDKILRQLEQLQVSLLIDNITRASASAVPGHRISPWKPGEGPLPHGLFSRFAKSSVRRRSKSGVIQPPTI